MGVLLVVGLVLTLIGLSMMSGFMSGLIGLAGSALIVGGIVAAVVGGASVMFNVFVNRATGVGLLALGIALAVVGTIMNFVLRLWFVSWLIDFGGVVMLIIGIIIAALGLIGLLKGSGSKRYTI